MATLKEAKESAVTDFVFRENDGHEVRVLLMCASKRFDQPTYFTVYAPRPLSGEEKQEIALWADQMATQGMAVHIDWLVAKPDEEAKTTR